MQMADASPGRTSDFRKKATVAELSGPLTHQQSINAQQRQIYGESWADRFGRLLRGYGVSQARLAGVIGLSAPMISQLMSGQRVKISNPAVYGRIVRLEELLRSPEMSTADPARRAELLNEVAASQPSLTTRNVEITDQTTVLAVSADTAGGAERIAIEVLARTAGSDQLRSTAQLARELGADVLADLLTAAAMLKSTGDR